MLSDKTLLTSYHQNHQEIKCAKLGENQINGLRVVRFTLAFFQVSFKMLGKFGR